jgi:Na+-translocating ferredoxin:NAD+ oxidoreductase RnfC subunit
LLAPPPNPQAGGPPTVGCPRQLIQYIRSYKTEVTITETETELKKKRQNSAPLETGQILLTRDLDVRNQTVVEFLKKCASKVMYHIRASLLVELVR